MTHMADSIALPDNATLQLSLNLIFFLLLNYFFFILKNWEEWEVMLQKLTIIMEKVLHTWRVSVLILNSDSLHEFEMLHNFSVSQVFWKRNDN